VFDLAEASVTGRRTRIPELALGVLLVAGCALAAVAWQTLSDPSRAVLAVRNDIDRGDIITAADLQAVEIATDDQVNLIPSGSAATMVGRIAQVDLATGTLLTTAMAADVAAIGDGQALVGLPVERGSLPSTSLRPGSRVDVVLTPSDDDDASLLSTDGAVLVAGAEVSEVTGTASGNDRTVYVSLLVTQDDAVKLARAAAHDRVHLIEVPEAGR
jgi:hypothetical protein